MHILLQLWYSSCKSYDRWVMEGTMDEYTSVYKAIYRKMNEMVTLYWMPWYFIAMRLQWLAFLQGESTASCHLRMQTLPTLVWYLNLISNTPPQVRCNLSTFMKCFALIFSSALVRILAAMSSVEQWISLIYLFCTSNHMKWYLISTCFILMRYDPYLLQIVSQNTR